MITARSSTGGAVISGRIFAPGGKGTDGLHNLTVNEVFTLNGGESFAPILINGGGPAFTDSTGQVWSADQYFSGGFTYATATTTAIGGTVEDTLYRSERFGNFSYNLPVPNGTYAVTLAFAEIYWTSAGQRLFNVSIEGQPVISNLDIFATVGANAALNLTFQTAVTDGTLNITFVTVQDNAKVSAVRVVAVTGGTNQAPVVNAGLDKAITLPTSSVGLAGTATDDGLPAPPASLTYAWSVVSGPAAVTFSASTELTTTATFTAAGTYTLRLTASDSVLSGTDDVVVTVNAVASFAPILINGGGPAFTDSTGQVWSADQYFSGGFTYATATTTAIGGTVEDTLYRSERFGNFSYNLPVPNGTYAVTLAFAEIYWTSAGQRLFNVSIEGQPVISNLDIFATVGANAALNLTFQTAVTDGTLNITFVTVQDNAKVSAVRVVAVTGGTNQAPVVNAGLDKAITLPTSSVGLAGTATDDGLPAPPASLTYAWSVVSGPAAVTFSASTELTTTATFTAAGTYTLRLTASDSVLSGTDDVVVTVNAVASFAPILINGGGPAFTDSTGQVWSADQYFSGGFTYATATTTAIGGTVEDTLYRSERFGNFSYNLPVPNGTYAVTLAFAEIYWTSAGQRLFNVSIEGQPVISNLDIFATVGANAALNLTFQTAVTDGTLNITFVTVQDNAKVSAVRVVAVTGGTNQAPVVNAGLDKAITLPTSSVGLAGTATDDGLPTPPASLTYAWSVVSGPAAVTFSAPTELTTTATFTAAGTYTLRLTASDSVLSGTDDVVVTVNAVASFAPILINAAGPAFTDSTGQVWSADQYFSGGFTYATATTTAIGGTVEDTLYRSERFGNFSYNLPVPNGTYAVTLAFAEIYWTSAGQRLFNVSIEGQPVISNLDIFATVGANTALNLTFQTAVTDGTLDITFVTVQDNAKVSAIEIRPHSGDPFLHVVIDAPDYVVDYDSSGSEVVALMGQGSHTHQLGHHISGWVWAEGATVLGTTANLSVPLSVGSHTLSLTIQDDNVPPRSLTDAIVVAVYPLNAVGGVLAQYYPAAGVPLTTLIDALPSQPGFIEVLPTLGVAPASGKVGGSSYTSNVVVSLKADYVVTISGTYQFALSGGTATRFFLNEATVTGPLTLVAGTYPIEARFALPDVTSLPAQVMVSINGGAAGVIPGTFLQHDETLAKPFINSMPASGSTLGGESVTINGFGFFPSAAVTVHWGSSVLPSSSLFITSTAIAVTTPAGVGTVDVTIQTPNGISNAAAFTYTADVVPVAFSASQIVAALTNPTQAAWGPDERLYVGTVTGQIAIYTFDDNYAVINTQMINGVSGLSNNNILGIAFNPLDPPSPVKVYVSHSALFVNGGTCF